MSGSLIMKTNTYKTTICDYNDNYDKILCNPRLFVKFA